MTAIDISSWQHHPDFVQVRAAGVSLVIMKCGGGEGGRLYTDSVYVANRAAARNAGLAVGSYFFNGPVDPTAAADYQWGVIDWRAGDIVAIDVENSTGVTRWTPAQVLAWVNRIISHGVPASQILVYMSSSVTTSVNWSAVAATGVGLWVAQYGSNNGTPQGSPKIAYWSSWTLWQYTSAKTWPGIIGNVDTNEIAPSWAGDGTPIQFGPVIDYALLRRQKEDTMYIKGQTNATVYNVYTDANGKGRVRVCGPLEANWATTGGLIISGWDAPLEALGKELGYTFGQSNPVPVVAATISQAELNSAVAAAIAGLPDTGITKQDVQDVLNGLVLKPVQQ